MGRERRGRAQGKRDMREGKRDRCNETEKRTVGPRERKRETERAEGIEKTQRKREGMQTSERERERHMQSSREGQLQGGVGRRGGKEEATGPDLRAEVDFFVRGKVYNPGL
jgi:hypothetical protein